ncbi:MYOSIN-LIKE PROTEIN [Salix koriyanagi]|uniref:MYOSIN-LIKE PROTEIN n=1 Tax=Salix koriyanagi TaxID=2511006 RepID=A0A9Q0TQR6_9ROSI|nr:MYOSIN-LIKE PROTEIN [Salix koriyanagi]
MDKVSTTTTTMTTRRPKWQYPPAQPSPRILYLPRRPRRKPQVPKANATKPSSQRSDKKGKLEDLFDQERRFARGAMPIMIVSGCKGDQCFEEERRERVEERERVVMKEEKWRFQAEMLRAECNLLRMEREIAVKKMERRRVQMERILRSAVRTLLSGRKGICDGKDVSMVLDVEIQELVEKLEKLQRRSGVKDLEVRKCSNLDRQVSLLQRRLKKLGGELDEICVKEIQKVAEASLSIKTNCSVHETFASNCCGNMEILRRKMEGLSNRSLLERMEEEYGSMHSTDRSSAADYASTSKRIIEFPDMPSSSTRQPCKEVKTCSGCCKIIVRRVIEQVRAETEQWSQMQEMLGQVRNEMEELEASRDFWKDRALDSDCQIQSLNSSVQEWRQKALSSEAKENELQTQVAVLQVELERLRKERVKETSGSKNLPSVSLEAPNETEKRVLVCRLKENRDTNDDCRRKEAFSDGRRKPQHACAGGLDASKRSLLRDIGNSSPLARQNSRAVFYPVQENFKF